MSLLHQVLVRAWFHLIREPTAKHKEALGKTYEVIGSIGFVGYNNEDVFTAHVPRYVTEHCFI